jgi:hypothetical protein
MLPEGAAVPVAMGTMGYPVPTEDASGTMGTPVPPMTGAGEEGEVVG